MLAIGAGLVGLAVIAIVAAALIPGGSNDSKSRSASRRVAPHRIPPTSCAGASRRWSAPTSRPRSSAPRSPPRRTRGSPQTASRPAILCRCPPRAFAIPVAHFRAYAERWAVRLGHDLPALRGALASGSRPAAKRAWSVAWSDYLHLGAVYGLLPGHARRANGRACPRPFRERPTSPACTGSRWGSGRGAAPQSLVKWVVLLAARRRHPAARAAQRRDRSARLRDPRPRDPRGRPARLPQRRRRPLERRRRARHGRRDRRDQGADRDAGAAASGSRQHLRRGPELAPAAPAGVRRCAPSTAATGLR